MEKKNKLMFAAGCLALLAAFCFIAVGAVDDSSSSDNDVVLAASSAGPVAMIGTQGFDYLEDAFDAAGYGDTIILVQDYEMQFDAVLPEGALLLIPCMDNDVGYTSTGYNPDGTTSSVKALYRTLTI